MLHQMVTAEHAETTDEKKEKRRSDSVEKLKKLILKKKDNEIQSLKVKAETEKAKVAKKETEKDGKSRNR